MIDSDVRSLSVTSGEWLARQARACGLGLRSWVRRLGRGPGLGDAEDGLGGRSRSLSIEGGDIRFGRSEAHLKAFDFPEPAVGACLVDALAQVRAISTRR